jgi:hypothetical protein
VPAQAVAAAHALLPVIRARLVDLCDLNGVVRALKAASASASTGAGAGAAGAPADGSGRAAAGGPGSGDADALWEEAKIRSE